MTNFTKDQTYLKIATTQRAAVNRELGYAHHSSYPAIAQSEMARLDAAIVDIKSRLTEEEIKESEYVPETPIIRK